MTEDEYWDEVNRVFTENLKNGPGNKWRWGQTCMNVLRMHEDTVYVYNAITGTPADPWNAEVSSKTYDLFVKVVEDYFR